MSVRSRAGALAVAAVFVGCGARVSPPPAIPALTPHSFEVLWTVDTGG